MNKKEAAAAWHVSEREVKRICKHMKIDCANIPEDTKPVFVPDKWEALDPYRFYTYTLAVIENPALHLEGMDSLVLESCVTQLCKAGLIVLKKGADPSSADYRDYVISADRQKYYDWVGISSRQKIGMVEEFTRL